MVRQSLQQAVCSPHRDGSDDGGCVMPYYPPQSGAGGFGQQRDRITQALMQIQSPPPMTQMPQQPPMTQGVGMPQQQQQPMLPQGAPGMQGPQAPMMGGVAPSSAPPQLGGTAQMGGAMQMPGATMSQPGQ